MGSSMARSSVCASMPGMGARASSIMPMRWICAFFRRSSSLADTAGLPGLGAGRGDRGAAAARRDASAASSAPSSDPKSDPPPSSGGPSTGDGCFRIGDE